MKKIYLFLGLLLLITSCTPAEKVCKLDTDCVPAVCCHATEAVNKEHAPNCKGKFCTLDCSPNTIDCGQGELKCVSGECKIVLAQ